MKPENASEQHEISSHDALENLKTEEIKKKAEWLAPYQFKKGQSGNPNGRPAGKSLKEYAKDMINTMTDEERQVFLEGIDKRTIWEMAEGKAQADLTSGGQPITMNIVNYGSTDDTPPVPTA